MKTMSQVVSIADCPETLEEARQIIRELTEKRDRYYVAQREEIARLTKRLEATEASKLNSD